MLIKGEKVTLRRAGPADAERAYEWLALSDLTPALCGPPLYPDLPVPARAAFDERYPPRLFAAGNPYAGVALIITTDGRDVGVVICTAVNLLAATAELELWLAERAQCGRGFGSEALRLACAWLHDELGVDGFVIRPARRNVHALRAFRRAGFRSLQGDAGGLLRTLGLPPARLFDSEVMLLNLPRPAASLRIEADRGYVFLDAELTDPRAPRLVSVGAAASDATAFYCELAGWRREEASEFVLRSVLPLLDGEAVPRESAARAFAAWLATRAADRPVTVVTTSLFERWALAELLAGESLPAGVGWRRVPVGGAALDAAAAALRLRRHHALADAQSLRHLLQIQSAADAEPDG